MCGAGGAFWRFVTARDAVRIDPHTLCPDAPRGYVIILLDVSDALNNVQRAAVRNELSGVEEEINTYDRVRIFVIGSATRGDLPTALFDRCKPPSGRDASGLTQNPLHIHERWQTEYQQPLEAALEAVDRKDGSSESPLMQLIQATAVSAFPGRSVIVPRRLVVVSDFLQNTKDYSQYGASAPRFDDFERNPISRKLHTDLGGVDVKMLYLRRDGQSHIQTSAHLEFWKRFFTWSGVSAGHLTIVPIEG